MLRKKSLKSIPITKQNTHTHIQIRLKYFLFAERFQYKFIKIKNWNGKIKKKSRGFSCWMNQQQQKSGAKKCYWKNYNWHFDMWLLQNSITFCNFFPLISLFASIQFGNWSKNLTFKPITPLWKIYNVHQTNSNCCNCVSVWFHMFVQCYHRTLDLMAGMNIMIMMLPHS